MNIDDLLRIATERRASDLHLKVGNYPHLRIDGELVPLTEQPRITAEDMLNMAFSMMSARQKQKFKETTEIDMAYGVAGLGRFRVNIFQQRGNVGRVLRVIPTKIRALDELFLPKVVEQICDMPRGLVLVTGATGSGKSTTLAAMVDRVNSSRAAHHHDGRSDRISASGQEGLPQPAGEYGGSAGIRVGGALLCVKIQT